MLEALIEFKEWFGGFRERQLDYLKGFKPTEQDKEIWERTKNSIPLSCLFWFFFFYSGWMIFLWIYSILTSGFEPNVQIDFMEKYLSNGIYMIIGTVPISALMAILTTCSLLMPFPKLFVTVNSINYGMILFCLTTKDLQTTLAIDPNVVALYGGLLGLLSGMVIFNRMEEIIGIGWDGKEYVIYYDEYD